MIDDALVMRLFEIGAVQFGDFTLKSGIASPIYLDLRLIVSYPSLLKQVANAYWQLLQIISCDCVCGVPYTALPIATALSVEHEIPMVMRRKEIKDYGTKKIIEGVISAGARCAIIEDLVTSGKSTLETAYSLRDAELVVSDAFVLIDREQGAKGHLLEKGITLHAVMTISEILDVLYANDRLQLATVEAVKSFIKGNQTSAIAGN